MIHVLRSIPVPFKLYYATRYMSAQKNAIRDARRRGDFPAEAAAIRKASVDWGNQVIRAFHMDVSVDGLENLPRFEDGPVVLVSNHQGYSDIPVLLSTISTLPMSYVAKRMMGNLPFFGDWMKHWQYCVLMDRDDLRSSVQCLDQGTQLLQRGYSVAIFPEGHRSKGPVPGEFHRGSYHLAMRTGTPILPVSISGSYRVWEAQGYIKPAKIHVTIHPLVPTAGLSRTQRVEVAEQVTKTICAAL